MLRVLSVLGTRPEAIKMAPVIAELKRHEGKILSRTCLTSQHRDMVQPLIRLFDIEVDYDLNLMRENQSLDYLTVRVIEEVGKILREQSFDYVLVQGDTTTSMAASLAAFYCGTRIGHVEAGLRTYDKTQPYPEEVNRKIIDSVSDLFFAHTEHAKGNLVREGVRPSQIAVTGNTVIDALLDVAKREHRFSDPLLRALSEESRKIVLVTAHRRESFGDQFESICAGLKQLALTHANDVVIVYPVHRNPNVRKVVQRALTGLENVLLVDPLDYAPFVHLMKLSYLVLTDSGGIQEEAPSLGKPVLVLRNVTERQEAVDAGTVRLVGTDARAICDEASRLLTDPKAYEAMATKANPYGDGTAAVKIVARILEEANVSR
jgi:UDP-N-acetylglucosamine 2-epimerase (non-hydrolysing)